jgi:hypothetical protein
VAATVLSQSRIVRAVATTVATCDACPVVEGILEPRITGDSSREDTALAGAPGERRSKKGSAWRDSLIAGGLPIPLRAALRGRSDCFLAKT